MGLLMAYSSEARDPNNSMYNSIMIGSDILVTDRQTGHFIPPCRK